MRGSYDFNVSIRTLKKELPETSQVDVGDDVLILQEPVMTISHATSYIE